MKTRLLVGLRDAQNATDIGRYSALTSIRYFSMQQFFRALLSQTPDFRSVIITSFVDFFNYKKSATLFQYLPSLITKALKLN